MSTPQDVLLRPTWVDEPVAFSSAIVLVRLHGEPLGCFQVPVEAPSGLGDAGRVACSAIEKAIGCDAEVLAAVERHRARGRCRPTEPEPCRGAERAPGATPSVEVIVPTAGRPDQLRRTLESLQGLTYPSLSLTVVDNRPDDDGATRAVVEAFADARLPVRYIAERRPGSSVARNSGVALSGAEIVAFTDDDVVVAPDWCDWLVEPFRADPLVGATTGLVMPMHLETRAQVLFESYAGFGKGFERKVFDLGPNRADDRLLYPFWGGVFGSGNAMAFRRRTYLALDGLDPSLGAGSPARAGSDIEAFSRVILRGERLVYEPRSICWHEHRRSEEAFARQVRSYGIGLGAILTKSALAHPSFVPLVLRTLARNFRPSPPVDVSREDERGRAAHVTEEAPPAEADGRDAPSPLAVETQPPATSGPHVRRLVDLQLPARYRRSERRGLAYGPLALTHSRLWARRRKLDEVMRRPAPSSPSGGGQAPPRIPQIPAPIAVRRIDIDALPEDLDLGRGRSGEPYRGLEVLFQRSGRPMGIAVIASGPDGRVRGGQIADAADRILADRPSAATTGSDGHGAASLPQQALTTGPADVSVVVTTSRDEMRLIRCVASLLGDPDPHLAVIVVIERPAGPPTRAALEAAFGLDPRLQCVEEPGPGRASARNRGLAEATGSLVAFIDDDVVCQSGYAGMVREAFATQPAARCLTGLVLPLELETRSQMMLERFACTTGTSPLPDPASGGIAGGAVIPRGVRRFGQGANLVFPTAHLRRIGGFDPALGPGTPSSGGDDLDVIARVRGDGGEIIRHPGVIVWQEQPREMLQARQAAFAAGVGRSAVLTKALVSGGVGAATLRGVRTELPPPAGPQSPADLRLLERLGMCLGPVAYLRSRRRSGRP